VSDPILKGKEAKYLQENTLLNEILEAIDKECVDAIRSCEASDLIEYRARLDGVSFFRRALQAHLDNAVIASAKG
jgi:hypothetical protein